MCRISQKYRIFTVAALGMSFNVKFAASLNQQHEAPHCASHSLASQHGVPPNESPGMCFKTHPRSQEKDEFGIRELWASPSQRQMCCLWLLRLILLHVILLDFLVLMFLLYRFNFLKHNFFFFFLPVIWLFREKASFSKGALLKAPPLPVLII